MNKPYPFEELRNLIEQASSLAIIIPGNPQFDQVAAALAFKLASQKKGKPAAVLCPTAMTVEFNRLVGVETIGEKNESGSDLVVSLNYPLDQIEKVSYNDEGGKLNLVIQPKVNAPRPEKNQIQFSYQGGNKNLTVLMGVNNIASLGQLANNLDLQNAISINRFPGSQNTGGLNILDQEASSFCEIVVALISNLGWMADEDIAGNLLSGLEKVTRNFSAENIGPDAFEAVAVCLRWGAKRTVLLAESQKPVFENKPQAGFKNQSRPFNEPKQNRPAAGQNPSRQPSPDWLEPKIFKSSNI